MHWSNFSTSLSIILYKPSPSLYLTNISHLTPLHLSQISNINFLSFIAYITLNIHLFLKTTTTTTSKILHLSTTLFFPQQQTLQENNALLRAKKLKIRQQCSHY
jgi:hypothetical protein